MYIAFQIMTVMLAAVTMALSLAHALELPGKLRLNKEQYLAVQAIYYPGFTLGGIAEFASVVVAVTLLILTPRNSPQFWLISAALAALVAVQVIFWTMNQPVNKYWLQNTELSRVAARFFQTSSAVPVGDWTDARSAGALARPSCGCLRASRVASDHGCRPVTPRDVLALSGLFKRTHLEVRFLRKSGHACEHVECPKMTQSGHSRVARCALMSVHLNC